MIPSNTGFCLDCFKRRVVCEVNDVTHPPASTEHMYYFLTNGFSKFPTFTIEKFTDSASNPSSSHQTVVIDFQPLDYLLLNDTILDPYKKRMKNQNKSSMSLINMESELRINNNTFYFNNEADISTCVKLFLKDLASLLVGVSVIGGFDLKIGNLSSQFPDHLLILNREKPVLVVEVKVPSKTSILSTKTNCFGHLFDYMTLIRSKYGVVDVFGVLTDFISWHFCWFSDSNDYVLSQELNSNYYSVFTPITELLENRKFFSSNDVNLINPDLPSILLSFILRGIGARAYDGINKTLVFPSNSPIVGLNFVSEPIGLSQSNYYKFQLINSPNLEMSPIFHLSYTKEVLPNIPQFYSLHSYYTGKDGKASLMCYPLDLNKSPLVFNLIIVKVLYSTPKIDIDKNLKAELQGWRSFGIIPYHFNQSNRKTNILFLPYCFLLQKLNKNSVFSTKFDFNFQFFLTPMVLNFVRDESFVAEINKWNSDPHPAKTALEIALKSLWEENLEPRDLEWRHLGLMPFFQNQKFILKPILIDHSDTVKMKKENKPNFLVWLEEMKAKLLNPE